MYTIFLNKLCATLKEYYLSNNGLEICVERFAGAIIGSFNCLDHKPHLLLTNFIQSLPIEGMSIWESMGLQYLTSFGLDTCVVAESKGCKEKHGKISNHYH